MREPTVVPVSRRPSEVSGRHPPQKLIQNLESASKTSIYKADGLTGVGQIIYSPLTDDLNSQMLSHMVSPARVKLCK